MEQTEIDQKVKLFLSAKSIQEIALALGIRYSRLVYNLYKVPIEKRYELFEIKKRSGALRQIYSPIVGLKVIQRKLNFLLQHIYPSKKAVHGFVFHKGIKSNADIHVGKRFVINLDIQDFFPSINFGRVRGLFMAHPFNFDDKIATVLAQICCHNNFLPQGAPTSPIISNFICRRLDNDFLELLSKQRCSYTRYADDISISTNLKAIPLDVAVLGTDKIDLSEKVCKIFESNGFKINQAKVRYATRFNRQEVTGLIVNEFVNVPRQYIRHVRAMLNAWEKYQITLAAKEHFEKYNYKNKKTFNPEESFKNELIGKIGYIGYIKGKDNATFKGLHSRLTKLAPDVQLSVIQNEIEASKNPIIYGEGKTDGLHLKKALRKLKSKGLFKNLHLNFHEYNKNSEISNSYLLNICESLSKTETNSKLVICLFDRDDRNYTAKIVDGTKNYKHFGNNVYSLLMPVPPHRTFDQICIEHYYLDEELKRKDKNDRRLYFSDEFDSATGHHIVEDLNYKYKDSLKAPYPKILDHSVFNSKKQNVALSKMNFANNIVNDVHGFHDFTFAHFQPLFKSIEEIIAEFNKNNSAGISI